MASEGLAIIYPNVVGSYDLVGNLFVHGRRLNLLLEVPPCRCLCPDKVHFLSCELLFDFDALLGPGELYLLRHRDILFFHHHAVVRLRDSTSSKKKASRKWWLTAWLFFWRRKACKPLKPNDLLLQLPPLN